MPIPVEAIQGYLMRAGIKFAVSDLGHTGQFVLSFRTQNYRNPGGKKSLTLLVTILEDGRYLEIVGGNMYSATQAKDVGVLCQYLLGQNYTTKLLRWELDRTDNEVRATIEVAPVDGCITFDAFMRMLMLFPLVADSVHAAVTKVMTTGKLPAPVRTNKRLQDLLRRAGGMAGLERLIREHEDVTRRALTIDPLVAECCGRGEETIAPASAPGEVTEPAPSPDCEPEARHDVRTDSPSDALPPNDDGPCACDETSEG